MTKSRRGNSSKRRSQKSKGKPNHLRESIFIGLAVGIVIVALAAVFLVATANRNQNMSIPTLAVISSSTPTSLPLPAATSLQDTLSLSIIEIDGIEQVVTSNTGRVQNRGDVDVRLGIHIAAGANIDVLLEAIAAETTVYAATIASEDTPLSIDLTIYSDTGFDRWLYSANGWRVIERNGVPVTPTPVPTPLPQVVQPANVQSSNSGNTGRNQSVAPQPASFTCNCNKTCEQMVSCAEAYFQLNQCRCNERDADNDGIPCDNDCQ